MRKILAVMMLSLSACPGLKVIDSFSASANGQTVNGTIDSSGKACVTYAPPIIYLGESCSQTCASINPPSFTLVCSAAVTAALHTVTLTRVLP